ncbi:MAG TPA: cytochrome c maturation protein CcmE [Rhodocyclaceae bacterium]
MKPRHKRIALIVGGLSTVAIAAVLVLNALNSNIALYITPTEVTQGKAPKEQAFRIGGLVLQGSLKRQDLDVHFIVTDTAKEIPVVYRGILPDLFKEGKGVVAQGKLNASGQFVATEVLAKHDENYMPPAAQDAINQANKAKQGAAAPKAPSY